MRQSESTVQAEILDYLATRPDVRAWRANSGAAFSPTGALVRFGVPGQADVSGLLATGRRLEIEVKSATGRLTPQQRRFQAMIERFGGLYVVARSVDDVRAALP